VGQSERVADKLRGIANYPQAVQVQRDMLLKDPASPSQVHVDIVSIDMDSLDYTKLHAAASEPRHMVGRGAYL
jgi:hypothetical protein